MFIQGKFYDTGHITSKMVYKQFVRAIEKPPRAKLYFEKMYDIDPQIWEKIYLLPAKATLDSRTRMFQYMLLNNVSYLNKTLHKMGKVDQHLCSLCKEKIKLSVICFFERQGSAAYWESIQRWCSSYLTLPDISEINTVTGFHSGTKRLNLENHILLLFKKFPFEKGIKPYQVILNAFKFFVRHAYKIEYNILQNKETFEKQFEKWEPLEPLLKSI